jgi:acetyl esterase/lipase
MVQKNCDSEESKMASIQSYIFNFILRHSHLLRFQLKRRSLIDWNTSIPKFREDCEKSAGLLGKVPQGIEVTPVTIEGIPAEWILPAGSGKDKIILYAHGGGYVSGSCNDHRALVARIVKNSGIGALLIDYRLAPEHPFPAALDDTVTVYKYLLKEGFSPSKLMIVGESAGGGLCLATLLALKERNIPLPSAAVAMSPWTDLKCTGESYRTKAGVCLSPGDAWTIFSKYYVGDNDPTFPLISPLYGDLQGLPPLFITVGEYEVLYDDALMFAEKAKSAGVYVILKIGEKMVHCYPLLPPFIPEARMEMDEICNFIKTHINK